MLKTNPSAADTPHSRLSGASVMSSPHRAHPSLRTDPIIYRQFHPDTSTDSSLHASVHTSSPHAHRYHPYQRPMPASTLPILKQDIATDAAHTLDLFGPLPEPIPSAAHSRVAHSLLESIPNDNNNNDDDDAGVFADIAQFTQQYIGQPAVLLSPPSSPTMFAHDALDEPDQDFVLFP